MENYSEDLNRRRKSSCPRGILQINLEQGYGIKVGKSLRFQRLI